MTTTDPTAGPQIVSDDYDEAGVNYGAVQREIESLRVQLAEAREQRDQAAEALVRAETERDAARDAHRRLAEALGFPGGDLCEAIRALRRERDDALQEAESVGRQLHSSTREVDRLIAQLATVTQERDRWQQLAEERAKNLHATLKRAFAAEDVALAARREAEALKAELDEARAEIARIERAAHEQGADLWTAEDRLDWLRKRVRLAMDLLCSPTVPRESGPDVPGAYGILSHALAATAPETALESPQTDEQAQVRGKSRTESQTGSDGPLTTWCRTQLSDADIKAWLDEVRRERERQAGSQGPLDLDAIRAAWLRACGPCDAGYPTACSCPPGDPRTVIAALVAEIDRLRTEAAMLRAEREWLADRARTMGIAEAIIAAHGPARAVIVEAARLRAKVKHLSARIREWEAVNADLAARCDSGDIPIRLGERYSQAVLREIDRLRAALGSTPDTGDSEGDQS